MGDTCDFVSPHQIDGSLIVNDVAHVNNTDKNSNKSGSQLKILDYYKPSAVKSNETIDPVSEFSSTKPKINSIAQSILEDVCNDFENFDVVFTDKVTNETDDNHNSSVSESGNQGSDHLVTEVAQFSKSNDTSVDQLMFECEKVAVSNSADAFILKLVPGTSFGKGHAPILEEIINDPKKCHVAEIKVSTAFIGDESQNSTISFEKINPAGENFCSVSPQASNSGMENDSQTGMSSFTVTDSVTVLKNMPAQHIQFDVFEISDPYLGPENSVCVENVEIEQEERGQALLESERQHAEVADDCSSDVTDTKSISNDPVVTGVEQVVSASVHVPTNVRNTKARRISAKMKKQWAKELEISGHVTCPMPGCHQKYVTVANFQTHYKYCTGKKTLQHCPYCDSLIFTEPQAVLHHMVVEHPDKVDAKEREKCSSADSLVPHENEGVISYLKKCKPKSAKKRNFSLKENMLSQKTSLKKKDGLKIIERTMDENYQEFKKCVRFNDIVQKINAVSEEVRFLKHKRKIILAETSSSIDMRDSNFVNNEDEEESVDCPSHFNRSPRRVTTKSRIVLNTQGYKRFNESLKLTRDWASERKTYSRQKSADNSCNSCLDDTSSLLADVKDTYVLNDSSEQSGISLSVSDVEKYCNGEMIPLESPVLQSCIKKVPGKAIEIHNKRTIKPRNNLDGSFVSQVVTEEKREILLNSNEDKAKNIRPALTPEPAPEVNYGHLIFAKPSKIKTERFTCYDNVNNKLFSKEEFNDRNLDTVSVSRTEMLEEKNVCENFSNVDFDSLIGTPVCIPSVPTHREYGRKRGRGRGRFSRNSVISEVIGQASKKGKHRKEDGVKMPPVSVNCKENGVKMPAVDTNKIRKKRGRPPKYLKLEMTPEVKMKKNNEALLKKNVKSSPIIYNQSLSPIKTNIDGDVALTYNLENAPKFFSSESNHLGNESDLQKSELHTISKETAFDKKSKDIAVEKNNVVIDSFSPETHIFSQIKEVEQYMLYSNMAFVPTLRCLAAKVVQDNYLSCKNGESDDLESSVEAKGLPYKSCISTNVLCDSFSSDGARVGDLVKPILSVNNTSESAVDIPMQKLKPKVDGTRESKRSELMENTINVVKELILDLKEKVISIICKNNNTQDVLSTEKSDLVNQFSSEIREPLNIHTQKILAHEQLPSENNFELGPCSKPSGTHETNSPVVSNLRVRKRGRPPKVEAAHENCIEQAVSVSNELNLSSDAVSGELPAKRKRGRPRKKTSSDKCFEDANITQTPPFCEASLETLNCVCDPVSDAPLIKLNHDFIDRTVAIADVKENTTSATSFENIQHNLSSSELNHPSELEENVRNKKVSNDSFVSKLPAVRKSSRVRKHKVDPDAVFLLPKKKASSKKSLNESTKLNEKPLNQGLELALKTEVTHIRTGKRGRPRKVDINSKNPEEPHPNSKFNNSALISNNILVVPKERERDKDSSLNYTRKGSRKGSPRKCVRYADLNLGIDSPESCVTTPETVESDVCVFTNPVKQDDLKAFSENQNSTAVSEVDKHSEENKTLACANDINVMRREFREDNVVRAFMDFYFNKSKNRRKLEKKILNKIKLKNARRRKKLKLCKINSASNPLPQKKSNLQRNFVPLQTPAIDASCVPEVNAVQSCVQVKQEKLSRKNVRSAAIKARQLMENMMRIESDGKIEKEVKEELKEKDADFVPDVEDDEIIPDVEDDEIIPDVEVDECENGSDVQTKLMKYKQYFESPKFEMPVVTKQLIEAWRIELERDGIIRCKTQGCVKAFSTKAGMIYHYEVACQRKLHSTRCTICEKKFKPYSAQLLNHMEKLHFPDGQISNQLSSSPKKREINLSSHKEEHFEPSLHLIFAENSKIKSLEKFKSVKSAWKFLDSNEYKEFIPLETSMMIKTQKRNLESSVWFELPCFKSSFDDPRKVAFFVGGYVTSSAWCPTPYGSKSTQYICLATCSKFTDCHSSDVGLLQHENEIGLLQLYHVGDLTSDRLNQPPAFSLAIAHRHGLVKSMVWCPHGCWEDPLSVTDVSSDILPRLGVLAIACSEKIKLYSIPHPENLKCPTGRLPIAATRPCVILHPVFGGKSSVTQRAMCTSVSWKRTKSFDYIIGGYSNGLVTVWNITKCHKKVLPSQTHTTDVLNEKYVPFLTFQAHAGPVTCITFSPFPDQLFAATGSVDRLLKIWDLDDTSMPVREYRRGIVRSVQWPLIWSGVFVSCDDGFNAKETAYIDLGSIKFVRTISNNSCCEWSSSVSECLNAAAVGSATGTLSVTVLQRLNFAHHAVHNPAMMPIFHTEVVSMDKDLELYSAIMNKPAIIGTSPTFLPLPFNILPNKITRTKSRDTMEHMHLVNSYGSNEFQKGVKNFRKTDCVCDVVPCDKELNSCICAVSCHQTCHVSEVLESILRRIDNVVSEQHKSDPNRTDVLKSNLDIPQMSHHCNSKPELKTSLKMNAQSSFATPLEKFVATSKNYGLKFVDFEMDQYGDFLSANTTERVKNSERNSCVASCFNGFHLASIDSVQWNPNCEAKSWLYTVGESGIVRLINVAGLKKTHAQN